MCYEPFSLARYWRFTFSLDFDLAFYFNEYDVSTLEISIP